MTANASGAEPGPARRFADDPTPFLDHLEELRWTILRCLLALGVCVVAVIPLSRHILVWLQAPLYRCVPEPENFLRSLQVHGAFRVLMQVSLWGGLILSTPVLFFLVCRFIFPALTPAEKRAVHRSVGPACALFLTGVLMGYHATLPVALRVMFGLHDWMGIAAEWTIDSYISFVSNLLLGFGVAFEMPLVVLLLGYLGIVSAADLRAKRRHVVVVLLAVAMLLTPPDWVTQIMMAVPLYIMYEGSILLVALRERRQR
jgi:sec-independent protein translocase protein TatC